MDVTTTMLMEIINQQKLENNNKCKSDTYYVPYESFPSSLIFCTLDSFLITINIISYHNKDNEISTTVYTFTFIG